MSFVDRSHSRRMPTERAIRVDKSALFDATKSLWPATIDLTKDPAGPYDIYWAVEKIVLLDDDWRQIAMWSFHQALSDMEKKASATGASIISPHPMSFGASSLPQAKSVPQRPPASGFVLAASIVEKHRQLDPRDVLVGELPTLIPRQRCEAGRQMGCADGAVGFVDMLPARSPGAERLVANVLVMQVRRFRTRRRTVPEPSQFPAPHRCTL